MFQFEVNITLYNFIPQFLDRVILRCDVLIYKIVSIRILGQIFMFPSSPRNIYVLIKKNLEVGIVNFDSNINILSYLIHIIISYLTVGLNDVTPLNSSKVHLYIPGFIYSVILNISMQEVLCYFIYFQWGKILYFGLKLKPRHSFCSKLM